MISGVNNALPVDPIYFKGLYSDGFLLDSVGNNEFICFFSLLLRTLGLLSP